MKKKIILWLAVFCAVVAFYLFFVRAHDNTALPFVNDPAALGKWTSVDFVTKPERFTPGVKSWGGDLFLKGLTFFPGGRMFEPWWTWTKGVVINKGERTAAAYEIRTLNGKDYLFMQWKNGEYINFHKPPFYYVFVRGAYVGDGTDIIRDNINLPFADDPEVLGSWASVDFVDAPEEFRPGKKSWSEGLYLKELVFLPDGKSTSGWLTWTKGVVMHRGNGTASHYEIKELKGAKYMFFEWKSGDYTIRHRKPSYYVLKKQAGLRLDDINLPFKDDTAVLGAWESVDFVDGPEKFDPAVKAWAGDLYLKKLVFRAKGKSDKPWWTWTKGLVLHHGDKTASKYEIKKIGGADYLFFEWKSGDYVFRGAKPFYYVLKRK